MGEYDEIGRNSKSRTQSGFSRAAVVSPASNTLVKAPFSWLLVSVVVLLLSPSVLFFMGTSVRGFTIAYGLGIIATLLTVLGTFEDQRRMRSPSYSLNRNFRKFGFVLYLISSVLVVTYLVLVASRAATQ